MTGALKKSKKMVVRKETVMPENLLLKLPSGATEMVTRRFNWLSNEEIASILVNFAKHDEWLTKSRVSRYIYVIYTNFYKVLWLKIIFTSFLLRA